MKIKVTELPKKPTDCLFCGKIWKCDENGCRESWECEIGGICRNTAECTKLEPESQIPKEGEWIDLFGHDYKCSVCGEWYRMDGTPEQEDMNYCPNCGARMAKGEHNNGNAV